MGRNLGIYYFNFPMKILCYRPGVCRNATAFEAQALIYKRLDTEYGHDFRLMIEATDPFEDADIDIVRLRRSTVRNRFSQCLPIYPKALRQQIAEFRPDFLLGLDPGVYPQGFESLSASKNYQLPFLFDVSKTILEFRSKVKNIILRKRLNSLLCGRGGVIATSPKCLERLALLPGFPLDLMNKVLILGHPFNENKIKIKGNHDDPMKKITVISRLVVEKGIHYILEGVAPLLIRHPNWHLQFVGSGPLEGLIRNFAKEKGVESQICCLGKQPHEKIAQILCDSDIFVNHAVDTPTWEEYFGVANIEAMASGLPCVLSDSGSIPWVTRALGSAIIVPQRSTASLYREVKKLISSQALRIEVGNRARIFAWREYSSKQITSRYNQYLNCIHQPSFPSS